MHHDQATIQEILDIIKRERRWRRWLMWRWVVLLVLIFLAARSCDITTNVPDFVGVEDAVFEAADRTAPHIAVLPFYGMIGANGNINAEAFGERLERAFDNDNARAVVVVANSPGGSAVQSDLIMRAVARARQEYPDKPIWLVVEDVCASGCYYAFAAADAIVANPASIVGSIGVRMEGFGVEELMANLGIEYRGLTAGTDKSIASPFAPFTQAQRAHMEGVLASMHETFIEAVKTGRGDKLTAPDATLFNGLYWTGAQAIDLGLVDTLGSLADARAVLDDLPLIVYRTHKPWWNRVLEEVSLAIRATFAAGSARPAYQL